ncbi:glycerol-3-phosphate dehydrogenase/oxidase [Microbacterium rhizomatis]|uniref:Glycerol-3-phosphate dehydrogenase/oxidase n=1 Tax=Microbacterium rhizomatis TaxID=1631477 RepID=A0A5J5J0H5_9MICO|nr:glycerol-3-phosphate dehydrogenase/oxidase [Microbacterium rhizomatis]KAA9106349.1 glycerol-3-phosphate dehydrogenase/oxidase [Microbacterium rhizomatis]
MTSQHPPSTARESALEEARARRRADVLIIGGGINGLGLLRELALQGVDVTLVERDDFVSGASAGSSHMVHGGIRYLENGEFRLVRESVQERNALIRLAPHRVVPQATTIPIYSTFSGLLSAPLTFLTGSKRPGRQRGAIVIKVGLALYDAYSRAGRTVRRHRFTGRRRALADLPELNPRVKYAATYYDAVMASPERLALDVLADAVACGPAVRALNYVEAVGLDADGVLVRDRLTGREFTLDAELIVNATGPWTDLTNGALGRTTVFMGGTKGSHIVLDHPELLAATRGRELFFEHEDGRIVLILPLGDRVLVGTTDLEHRMGDPIVCSDAEVDYFLDLVPTVLPGIRVDRSQIVFRFAGVRPLPAHGDASAGAVSRDYRIEEREDAGRPGRTLLSLVGGKWTTFRALAAELGARILGELNRPGPVDTSDAPIGGGRGYPVTPVARSAWIESHADGVARSRVDQLLSRYGTAATAYIDAISGGSDAPLGYAPGYSRAEIRHLVETESVCHLDDVLLRRTTLAFEGRVTDELLAELAEIVGDALGWDHDVRAAEVARTAGILRERHGVDLETPAAYPARG